MTPNRFSRLPVAEFCGRSGELDIGSGRAAAMSTAFHAVCSGAVDATAKCAALTAAEKEEIKTWHRPESIRFDDGEELSYENAEKELQIGLDSRGRHCLDPSKAIVIGTLDMAWSRADIDGVPPDQTVSVDALGRVVAYVGDIKKTRWTTLDGPESLQLIGYAFAYAAKVGATHFCCGIWNATEGGWTWGELIDLESPKAVELWARVVHASQNQGGEFRTGGHCRSCWSRMKCPAYLVPVDSAHALAPLAGHEITPDKVLELLRQYERASDTLDVVKEFLTEYGRRHPVPSEDGKKRWMPVECQGREGLAPEHKEDARKAGWMKRGAPYEQMRWVKA